MPLLGMNIDLQCVSERNTTMAVTIHLPDDLEHAIEVKAAKQGLSLPDYILQLIALGMNTNLQPKNGAELVEYWQNEGLIGYRSDIADSQSHASEIRSQASHRL